jgi:hypothetical protein
MQKRNAAFLAPLAAVGVTLLVVTAGLASAAGKQAGGVVHIYEVSPSLSGSVATDILTGAITDHGVDHEGAPVGKTTNKLVLTKGSFEVSVARLVSQPPPPVDPKTCSFAFSVTEPTPIVKGKGTGAYSGMSGTFKVTVTEAGILPKLKSGKCNEGPTATPVAGVVSVKGSGTVSFK